MKQCFFQRILGCFLLILSFLVGAQESISQHLAQDVFAKCQFAIQETAHLKLSENSSGDNERPHCFIGLMRPDNLFVDALTDIRIFGKALYAANRNSYDVGFSQDTNGKWAFAGTDLLLSSKMLKASFMQELSESETLLVGYQLIRGNIAQGGPITVPGIRILRIAPEFLVSVELNFQPTHYEKQNKDYKQLREAVSKELVDIVKSVQFAPGAAGPTVRPVISPINP